VLGIVQAHVAVSFIPARVKSGQSLFLESLEVMSGRDAILSFSCTYNSGL